MLNKKRVLNILASSDGAGARTVSQDVWTGCADPSRRLTILTKRMDDTPVRGQIISAEDGNFYCVTRCNKLTANVTDISTGNAFMVRAAAIIFVEDMRGPHWHLSRTRNKMVPLDGTIMAADPYKGFKPDWAKKATENKNAIADKSLVVASTESLKVLVDEAGNKLASKIYKQFISEEDFANMPKFIVELDSLLTKYRGDKPITKQEVEELGDELEEEDDYSGVDQVNSKEPEEELEDETKVEASFISSMKKHLNV
jgi:hypothetical protein